MISLCQSMLTHASKKYRTLLEKGTKSLKIETMFLNTAQHCSTARVETIFGVLCVNDCLW